MTGDDWRAWLTEKEDGALSRGWAGGDARKRAIAAEIARDSAGKHDAKVILSRLLKLTSPEALEAIAVADVLAVMPSVLAHHAAKAGEPPKPTEKLATVKAKKLFNAAVMDAIRAILPSERGGKKYVDWGETIATWVMINKRVSDKSGQGRGSRWGVYKGFDIPGNVLRKRFEDASKRGKFEILMTALASMPLTNEERTQLEKLCTDGIQKGQRLRAKD